MLYTERVHFYHRSVMRGTRSVLFYAPPTFPLFYTEVCSFIPVEHRPAASLVALYSSMDRLALDRILGSQRSERLLQSAKLTHMFSV
jgi:U3 small nucleolar RNA-associated protein 25